MSPFIQPLDSISGISTVAIMPPDHAALFAASPLPQAILDATWRVSAANKAWRNQVGYSIGNTGCDSTADCWFDLVHPDDLAHDLPKIGRLQAGGLTAYRCTTRLRAADGGWQTAELLVAAVGSGTGSDGQDGALVMVLPAAGDAPFVVVASTAAQPTASAAPSTIVHSEDAQHLATALSHDVRQHARLAGIYCSLLARGQLNERQRAQLNVIASHSDRLQQVLTGLVRWLRLAEEPLNHQPCDLADLWTTATADLADADCTSGELPMIIGDPHLLSDLLRELVLNAQRYHGVGRASIALHVTTDDRGWELRISDDGPGIAEHDRARVLLPLQRLHTWEEVPGYGMGLAIASRIAARHGGDLQIAAAPSGGCMVLVRLPR